MSLFEWLTVIGSTFTGAVAVGWTLMELNARYRKKIQQLESEKIVDSVNSVQVMVRDLKHTTDRELGTFLLRFEKTAEELKNKLHEADKTLTRHEEQIANILRETERQYSHWSKELDRMWTSIKEIAPGIFRVSETKKPK